LQYDSDGGKEISFRSGFIFSDNLALSAVFLRKGYPEWFGAAPAAQQIIDKI